MFCKCKKEKEESNHPPLTGDAASRSHINSFYHKSKGIEK
nr:MAG TPA: hypothetical protein [Caudoviricetes sp.]